MLNRLIHRLRPKRPDEETLRAIERSEQILARVEKQEPEVRRHVAFALRTMHENELAPKLRAALRGN